MRKFNNKNRSEKSSLRLVIPFFAVLYLLTVLAFIIPLRPDYSTMDKRRLTAFPEFSFESLLSGDYFDGINTWFSDTFPGRDSWLSLSMDIESLHGYSEVSISGDISGSAVVEVPTAPAATPSPSPTQEAQSPDEAEPAPAETPPAGWGGVAVDENASISLGSVIQIGDSAFNQLGFSQYYSEVYAASLNTLATELEGTGVRLISAPAPTSIGVMVEGDKLASLNCARQDEMLTYIHSLVREDVIKVDTVSPLIAHNSEYIYFRTDHHWTALGAYYCYEAIMGAAGMEAAPLESFTEFDQGEFEGTLYWQARNPRRLTIDNVMSYLPQGDISMTVHENADYGWEAQVVEDRSMDDPTNKYLCFIGGDHAFTVITNDSIPDAPSCILLKGSFGNSLAPFLTQNYHKVYVVDYRKYYRYNMSDLAEVYGADDIIVLPYLMATQGSEGTELFKYLLK